MYLDEHDELIPGDRVELTENMFKEDPFEMCVGLRGTVQHEDDTGNVHVRWDNGSSLALLKDVDKYKIIEDEE